MSDFGYRGASCASEGACASAPVPYPKRRPRRTSHVDEIPHDFSRGCLRNFAANAHGHGNHFFFNQHHGLRIIGGGYGYGYDSCGYLFNKWQYSGSYYWKRQFLLCNYCY